MSGAIELRTDRTRPGDNHSFQVISFIVTDSKQSDEEERDRVDLQEVERGRKGDSKLCNFNS